MNNMGVILDLEGTLISKGVEIEGSMEVLKYLMFNDIPFRIITNTVSKSLYDLSNKFHSIGIDISENYFINPIVPLRRFLLKNNIESFYFVGSEDIKINLGINSMYQDFPEYVILCDFEKINCNYELLNKIFTYIYKGSKLLTMSNSEYYLSKNGPKLDTGAFCRMFETYAKSMTSVFGKPSINIYNEASNQMGVECSEIIAIGDDVLTDIKGANEFGAYSILVKSGKYKVDDEVRIRPDEVIDRLIDIIPLLKARKRNC